MCSSLSSPNSCCAADVSEDFSDCEGEVDHEELNEDVYQDACEHPQLVLRQVGHSTSIPGHLGASRNMTDGEMATVSSDDCGSQTVTRDSKKSSKMRKSATGGISDTSVVLRTAGGDSVLVRKDSRSSENSGFPSGSAEGSSGSVNSIHSHGSAASASLDQLTNSIAKLKTKLSSPCNTIELGALEKCNEVNDNFESVTKFRMETDQEDSNNLLVCTSSQRQSQLRASPLSSCSSEGETPSAKKTRLQQKHPRKSKHGNSGTSTTNQ
ncbi:uncharacterized protein LOC142336403 [Convolutriloba macropyga]|uniref:uncharacterized protein LOC142336403 n=1 Tax=Convolutriloba macropyga TaxID=536237 RepID=UPI003F51F400